MYDDGLRLPPDRGRNSPRPFDSPPGVGLDAALNDLAEAYDAYIRDRSFGNNNEVILRVGEMLQFYVRRLR